ncbi:dipeptidase PepE [Gallaecimonas kandeliae]|uniref:dipeptidase PepE n=1 Tax=Gallaecimonas kandeliae TaxID=3029055 RepID=UPI00264A072C|nr:dipeptidase PepE [Gallaecimonas kandeliae]WKE67404.1 dipeptidase PepE [Gallaecimonas kandeliae]
MRALLLSASRAGDTPYLTHALPFIDALLKSNERELLFVPFAGVTISWDDYTAKVAEALAPLGISVTGIHQAADPVQAVKDAKAIAIGGGNTFRLLTELYGRELVAAIRDQVAEGMPYIGWSAGSNVAGKSIRTTNDMPIIYPPSFDAIQLVPFQLNPHFTDYVQPGHNGETRTERLTEFLTLNPQERVLCLPEGTALRRNGDKLTLLGGKVCYLMRFGETESIEAGSDLSHWL